MKPVVHDALAYCRYESDRCVRTVGVSRTLRDQLQQRLTLLVLQRAKNIRIRKRLTEDREKLIQQRRVLTHGASAKFLV